MTLAVALGFIGIVWSAFKIIFGTENNRKTFVDIMYKFLIFTLIMSLYPSITYGILDTAIKIGMHAGGGYQTLNAEFMNFRKDAENKVNLARNELERMLDSVADPANSKGKNLQLSEKLIQDIVARSTFTKEDEERLLSEYGQRYNIITNDDYRHQFNLASLRPINIMSELGGTSAAYNTTNFLTRNNLHDSLKTISEAADGKKAKMIAESKDGWDNPSVKHAVITLKAMSEVFDKNPAYDPERAAYAGSGYTTREYLFDPFMRDENNKQTSFPREP